MPIFIKECRTGPRDGTNNGEPSVLAVVRPDNNLPRGLFDLFHSVSTLSYIVLTLNHQILVSLSLET